MSMVRSHAWYPNLWRIHPVPASHYLPNDGTFLFVADGTHLVLACPRCGEETFVPVPLYEGATVFDRLECLSDGCFGYREPIRTAEWEARWFPLWHYLRRTPHLADRYPTALREAFKRYCRRSPTVTIRATGPSDWHYMGVPASLYASPDVRDVFNHGSIGSLVLGCYRCGGESFREPGGPYGQFQDREFCLTEGCIGVREPIRTAEWAIRWFPLWKRAGFLPGSGTEYEEWLNRQKEETS